MAQEKGPGCKRGLSHSSLWECPANPDLLCVLILLRVLFELVNAVFAAEGVGFSVPGVGDLGVGLVVLLDSAVFVDGFGRLSGRLGGWFFSGQWSIGRDKQASCEQQ